MNSHKAQLNGSICTSVKENFSSWNDILFDEHMFLRNGKFIFWKIMAKL